MLTVHVWMSMEITEILWMPMAAVSNILQNINFFSVQQTKETQTALEGE